MPHLNLLALAGPQKLSKAQLKVIEDSTRSPPRKRAKQASDNQGFQAQGLNHGASVSGPKGKGWSSVLKAPKCFTIFHVFYRL